MSNRLAIIALCLAGQFWLAAGAFAAPRELPAERAAGDVVEPVRLAGQALAGDGVSLDEAAARVRRQTGGRIIKAYTRRSNGRSVHYIRVLTRDGKVFTVRVDASSGRSL